MEQTVPIPAHTDPSPWEQSAEQPIEQTAEQPTAQPTEQAAEQPTEQPAQTAQAPIVTAQSIAANPLVKKLTAPTVLRSAGAALGVGIGSALVIAIINALIYTIGAGQLMAQDGELGSLMSFTGLGDFSSMVSGLNFLQMLTLSLIMGVSGAFSLSASAAGLSLESLVSVSATLPVGLSGMALLLGTAFGAYMLAHRYAVQLRWIGVISSVTVGLVSAVIYLALGAIFPLTVSASTGWFNASASLSGVTVRTFLMTFLIAGLGALAGYALAQYAPDSKHVFLAAWRWMHRTRGFVRTIAESVMVYASVFTVVAIIGLLVLVIANHDPGLLLLIPLMFPFLPIAMFVMGALGSLDAVTTGQQTLSISVFAADLNDSRWTLIVVVVVFVIATLYIALRASARAIYDRTYVTWSHSWKSPAAAAVIWLVLTFVVASWNATISVPSQGQYAVTLAPAAWFFLVAAVWAFLIEVVPLTFGPSLLAAIPGTWKLFAGGAAYTDEPVSQPVAEEPASASAQSETTAWMTPSTEDSVVQTFQATPTDTPVPSGTPSPMVPPIPQAAPAIPQPQPQPQRKPLSARQKTGIIVGCVVVGILVVLGIAYAALNATVFNPQTVADRYVAAIASGKYNEASTIADPQLDRDQRVLLTDKTAQAENATVTNARVTGITDNADGSKTVNVSYTLGGDTVDDSFTLASTGNRFLIFPDWTVTTPMLKELHITMDSSVPDLTINGIAVSEENAVSGSSDSELVFKVYPGTYRVTAAESALITVKPITMNTYASDYAYVEAEPTDALTEAIQTEINTQLQTCAASTEAEPEGCPFSMYVFREDRYRNFAWSITETPEVDYVSLSSGMFSTGRGEAQATYEYLSYDDTWNAEDYSTSLYLYGSFTINGDKVTVTIE